MYKTLYQYLLQYKNLSLPSIGTFSMQRNPSVVDFPNRLIHPPCYNIVFGAESVRPVGVFFQRLAAMLNISEREAIIEFNNFSFDVKDKIDRGSKISWNGVGVLNKSLEGVVQFVPSIPIVSEQPIAADKVIRQVAEHTVRVGEQEKTSQEMTAYLNQPDTIKSYWWIWAAAIALLSFLFLGRHFSTNGIDAIGAQQTLLPAETTASYQIIQ